MSMERQPVHEKMRPEMVIGMQNRNPNQNPETFVLGKRPRTIVSGFGFGFRFAFR